MAQAILSPLQLPPVNDAINVRTKQKVYAEDLAQRRWGRPDDFICPGCGNPVYLKRGIERAPHFAHYHGYDTAHCSYYHSSGAAGGDGSVRKIEPSALPLILQIRTDRRGRPHWSLQLAIPKLESPKGRITVVDGISGATPLDCAYLANEGARVFVRPQSADYRVNVTEDVSDADADRLLVGSPGLRSDAPTLFRAGLTGGRRLSDDGDLVWGESYLAIWESTWRPTFPAEIEYQELSTLSHGYRGGVFQLPLEADQRVSDWVAEALHRGINAPGVTLQIVSPLTASGLDDEVTIDPREEVVVAISSRGGTARLRSLAIDDGAEIVRRLRLQTGADVLFVSIGPIGPRRVRLSAEAYDGEPVAEFEIEGQERQRWPAPPPSLLVTRQIGSGETARTPLHSRAATVALIRVRDGEALLEDLQLPPPVSCAVSDGRQVYRTQPNMDFEDKRSLIEHLRLFLSEGRECVVDAGSFGRAVVPARSAADAIPIHKARLTVDSACRIRALTNLMLATGSPRLMLLDALLLAQLGRLLTLLNPRDARLLERFARQRWSIQLLPQARALAAQITQGEGKALKM